MAEYVDKYAKTSLTGEEFHYEKEKLPEPILEGYEHFIDLYYTAWETAFLNVDYVNKEGWKPILTCMPGCGFIWQWDSCFMTFITNYSNGTFTAFNNLDNLYRLQRDDGYISMAYDIEKEEPAYGELINPPLYSWVEWEQYLISGDCSRFKTVLPVLEGLYNYIEKNWRRNTGLYYYASCGAGGMDNSPRAAYGSFMNNGSDVAFVDLACQQSLNAKYIAKICEVLGETEKAEFYKKENERINALINKFHWSNKTGFYYDFFGRTNPDDKVKLINTKTAAAFWSLLCGAVTKDKISSMLSHLFNPEEFYAHTPFSSLSKDDLNYDPDGGYWCGSSWHPTTFAAIRGIYEQGYPHFAREAAVKLLEVMSAVAKNPAYGGIWECYSPEKDRPATRENGLLVKPDFVGWGGIGPVTCLIENVIGFNFNAPENKITFNVIHDRRSGIKNMKFNGGKVSIECTKYARKHGDAVFEIEAEKPFTLLIRISNNREREFSIPEGKTTINF